MVVVVDEKDAPEAGSYHSDSQEIAAGTLGMVVDNHHRRRNRHLHHPEDQNCHRRQRDHLHFMSAKGGKIKSEGERISVRWEHVIE